MSYMDRLCDNELCNHPFSDHHYVPEYGQAQCDSCLHAQVVAPCEDYQDHADTASALADSARTLEKYRAIS